MQRFQVRSIVGGIADYSDRGVLGSFKFASGLDIRKQTDSISCQQGLTEEGAGVIVDLILWLVPASDGNVYGFGDTGKIYKRDGITKVWTVVKTDSAKITGAAEWVHDNSKHYLYWTIGANLHRKELPGLANWSDVNADAGWPKTNLDDVAWHTMKVAGGALMICNANNLAMVGYDQSYTPEAVQFYPDELSKSLIERQDYVIIGTYKNNDSEKGALYSWKQEALNYIQRKEVPSRGINGILDTELTLMQCGDAGGLFYSDMINVLPVHTAPGGGKVNPDGVDIDDGLGLFGMFSGDNPGVYTLGRKRKNAPFVLNLDYPLDCDEIGSVKNLGSEMLISYQHGATHGVKLIDSTIKGTGIYNSLDLVAPKEFVKPLLWRSVTLKTKVMPAGCSIDFYYRVNKNGDWVQAYMSGNTVSFTSGDEGIFLVNAEGSIFEFKLVLNPSGNECPEVYLPIYVNFE